MNKNVYRRTLTFLGVAARVFALAALLGLWASHSQAAQSSAQFTVSINLLAASPQPGEPRQTGFCQKSTGAGAFGATVTFVCTTGAMVDISPDGPYRFVTNISIDGRPLSTVDSYTGIGTITSWRVVNLANLDYLEMMVHW